MRASLFNTESFPTAPRTARGVAATGSNTYYSGVFDLDGADGAGLYFETTGDLTGTWTLWRTSMENPVLTDDSDFAQESTLFASPTNPAGSVTKWAIELNGLRNWKWRLKYVNASGSGNLFADVSAHAAR